MTPSDLSAAFEAVLADLGCDPAGCREGDEWWRFEAGGLACQGGIHYQDVRVFASLCEISGDADLDAVYASLEERNQALPAGALARFIEADNYLQVRGLVPLDDASPAAIRAAIDAVAELAGSAAASGLRSTYRSW